MYNYLGHNYSFFSFGLGLSGLILILALWDLVWKGLGLWRAARNGQNGWFIAILILNTLGILPILYLYVFSTPDKDKKSSPEKSDKNEK